MDVTDFLPAYPLLEEDDKSSFRDILPESDRPEWDWYRKWEFYENRATSPPLPAATDSQFLRHQINIARFMSVHTGLDRLLLVHEPGTGKTSAALAMVEQVRSETDFYRGALVITSSENTRKAFLQEKELRVGVREKDGKMFVGPKDTDPYSYFYTFATREAFANAIHKDAAWMAKTYSRFLIVMDEVHGVGEPGTEQNPTMYDQYLLFFSQVRDCKVLFLTGTPMENDAYEMAYLLNLLTPHTPLPTRNQFTQKYLHSSEDGGALKARMHGHISYLRGTSSDVPKSFEGNVRYESFVLQVVEMSPEQTEVFLNTYNNVQSTEKTQEQKKKDAVYAHTQRANLMVFPVRGKDGSIRKVAEKSGLAEMVDTSGDVSGWSWKPDQHLFAGKTTTAEKIAELRRWSVKYAECIQHILDHPNELHFAYCELVSGGGADFFAFLLSQFIGRKVKLLTGSEGDYASTIQKFNEPENAQGQEIQVLIGSRVLAEAFTLKNVRHVHFLTVPWHYSRIDQVIARAYRYQSHAYLIQTFPNLHVDLNIHLYCALPHAFYQTIAPAIVPPNPLTVTSEESSEWSKQSFDFLVYRTCQDKDGDIKRVERWIMEASVDCALNYERNRIRDEELDDTRACQYQSCNFRCDGILPKEIRTPLTDAQIDRSTYDLLYSPVEKQVEARVTAGRVPFTISELSRDIQQDVQACWIGVSKVIQRGRVMRDVLGFPLFLALDGDCVYFSREPGQPCFLDAWEASRMSLYRTIDGKRWISDVSQTELVQHVQDVLSHTATDDEYAQYLSVLPDTFQEALLEQAYASRQGASQVKSPFITYVLDRSFLRSFLDTTSDPVISKRLPKRWRAFHPLRNEWTDTPIVMQDARSIILSPANPYVGVQSLDAHGKFVFKVMETKFYRFTQDDWRNYPELMANKHAKKIIPTGQVCVSTPKFMLLRCIAEYNIPFPADLIKPDDNQRMQQLSRDQLLDLYQKQTRKSKKNESYNDLYEAFHHEDKDVFHTFTVDKMRNLLQWNELDKPKMCPKLAEFFRTTHRMVSAFDLDDIRKEVTKNQEIVINEKIKEIDEQKSAKKKSTKPK